jgi:CDP-paratose 2-epimerase
MKILVTGLSRLIGSEVMHYFATLGHQLIGIDNNMRADFLDQVAIPAGIRIA